MKIATAKSRLSKSWKTEDWTWTQFVDRLRTPVRTGETLREYKAMSKDEQSKRKDVGGFVGGALAGGRRSADTVTERWLITLDADYSQPGDWQTFTSLNDECCCAYSTHSHTAAKPRLRWILPLKRAVSPEEYIAVARMVAKKTGLIERLDPTTYQPERLMYWPSCSDDAEYFFKEQIGEMVDPDAVLAEYGEGDAWKDASLWPISAREGEIIRHEERRQQADPTTKGGIVGAFCRVYSIPDAIEAFSLPYERCDGMAGERYTYTLGSTAAGAVVYGDGRWLYSNHATDPAGGMLCNAWDLVRVHKYGDLDEGSKTTDPTRLLSYKAMTDLALSDKKVQAEQVKTRAETVGRDFGDMGTIAPNSMVTATETDANDGIDTTNDGDAGEEKDAWVGQLVRNRKTGAPEPTLANARILLQNLPDFKDKLLYSKLGGGVYVDGDMPWPRTEDDLDKRKEGDVFEGSAYTGPHKMIGRPFDKVDRLNLYQLMEYDYGYKMTQKNNGMIDNAIQLAAMKHTCDPVRDYLEGLTWDGVERLDTFLIRYLGAEDCELNRVVTRLWMMGAVDRAIRPGCKFDSVLVLVGGQGIGKTKLLSMLAGGEDAYFTNSVGEITVNKSTTELLIGKWIVEFGEIDSVKKSSVTQFKNFISKQSDSFREPYAISAEDHPRRCVFAGTTNEMTFLRDDTGERRYWIVPCEGNAEEIAQGKRGRLEGLEQEIGQLWAEAYCRWEERLDENWKPGQRKRDVNTMLFLTDIKLEKAMEQRQNGYKLPDTIREDIEEYLEAARPDNWEDMSVEDRSGFFQGYWIGDEGACNYHIQTVTLKEIRTELYHEKPEDAARGGRSNVAFRITSIMDSMPGWIRDGRADVRSHGRSDRSTKWRKET